MLFFRKMSAFAASAIALFALSTAAQALSLTPSSPGVIGRNLGPSNCEPGCVYSTFGRLDDGSLTLLYKADAADEGGVPEEEDGSLQNNYSTVFANSREDSTISFDDGSAITCGVCYLVIKDGNHNPSYYFFELTAAGWNGTDDIILTDFWVGPGAISHVAIWGVSGRTSVPEPGTLGLLGLSLFGMAASMRRRRRNA